MNTPIGIGVIGAGAFTRQRHIPKFQEIPGVQIVAVCNRTRETALEVAQAFHIPRVFSDYRDVVALPEVDAVFIGTPPYAHHQIALAALAAGKHVLSEGRMATSLKQAQEMEAVARESGLKTMLVRTSFCLKGQRFVKKLLDEGYVGTARQVFGHWFVPSYVNPVIPLHWRQDVQVSGAINPLFLSPFWEVFIPWFGRGRRVLAQSTVFTSERRSSSEGPLVKVEVPDAINVITEMESGAIVTITQSGVALFGESRVEIYGDKGTIIYHVRSDEIFGGLAGDEGLRRLSIPPDLEETWQVEADFIRLLRGELDEGHPSFHEGVAYTEHAEAALISAREGRWVTLLLP